MVPADASGRLMLELLQPQRLRTVLDVESRQEAVSPPVPTPADLAGSEVVRQAAAGRPALTQLQRYYADHFSPHEPMYFVFGDEEPAAKFQLSMKYRLLSDRSPLATRFPRLKGLHVAYTQRSLWAITAVSSPFFDTSYMPELMFQSITRDVRPRGGLRWIGWQVAFQHESNGRDGADSRSLNYFYFRPLLALGDLQGWHMLLRPKLQVYAGDLGDENSDIKTFRGYGEVRTVIGKGNRLAISLLGRMGDEFEKGSLQVDVSYPTTFMTGNFAMYLQLQYWVGYGESLLGYNHRSEALRAGFSLAR
jgi:outer membrane phospholipase A